MLEIFVALLAMCLLYIVEQKIRIDKIAKSRDEWFDIAKDFASELYQEKNKNQRLKEYAKDEEQY